jgi:hypothetical protein
MAFDARADLRARVERREARFDRARASRGIDQSRVNDTHAPSGARFFRITSRRVSSEKRV